MHSSGGSRGFQARFPRNSLLKFIYSNRAVGLRCSNYSTFIRYHPVINVKYCWERGMKVDDLFFFFWAGVLVKLKLKPPFKNPGSTTVHAYTFLQLQLKLPNVLHFYDSDGWLCHSKLSTFYCSIMTQYHENRWYVHLP